MGSSPLTRGKPHARHRFSRFPGLIPTHAGKTHERGQHRQDDQAHPHSRGENRNEHVGGGLDLGSSPLTRGKPGRCVHLRRRAGLIPTHAGKTSTTTAAAALIWAHPRSRGENAERRSTPGALGGSSPLTRGKPSGSRPRSTARGLIPAHAGKTVGADAGVDAPGAHPRSRGENMMCAIVGFPVEGSSPLTRGKPRRFGARRIRLGLIPAHAGKTTRARPIRPTSKAHPRSRGENWDNVLYPLFDLGSSPLTRGKLTTALIAPSTIGLIPAHAGKTLVIRNVPRSTRAHPRSRGENPSLTCLPTVTVGSSPLTRGKLHTTT